VRRDRVNRGPSSSRRGGRGGCDRRDVVTWSLSCDVFILARAFADSSCDSVYAIASARLTNGDVDGAFISRAQDLTCPSSPYMERGCWRVSASTELHAVVESTFAAIRVSTILAVALFTRLVTARGRLRHCVRSSRDSVETAIGIGRDGEEEGDCLALERNAESSFSEGLREKFSWGSSWRKA